MKIEQNRKVLVCFFIEYRVEEALDRFDKHIKTKLVNTSKMVDSSIDINSIDNEYMINDIISSEFFSNLYDRNKIIEFKIIQIREKITTTNIIKFRGGVRL